MDLVLVGGEDLERRFPIQGTILVGREGSCDVIVQEARVSRRHFSLERVSDTEVMICDLSSNGTWVNQQKIDQILLKVGDVIEIGRLTRFEVQEAQENHEEESVYETLSLDTSSFGLNLPLEDLEKLMEETLAYLHMLQLAKDSQSLFRAVHIFLKDSLLADRLVLAVGEEFGFQRFENQETPLEKKNSQMPLSKTVIKRSYQECQGILARGNRGELDLSVSADVARISSAMAVPLEDAEGKVLGALYADRLGGGESFSIEDLKALAQAALPLGRALEACLLHEKLLKSQTPNDLIGSSEPMKRLREQMDRIAATSSPVLLEGPSGSGKKLVAKRLHQLGTRGLEPFVMIDAASLTESLAATELFGCVKGAFTGADHDQQGAFRRAQGGTLFLHHVDELSLDVQALLLRALEAGVIRPVGAAKEVPIDVRVISSVSGDLEEKVQQKTFRQDLFFRLQVITLRLPSLAERVGDIPELAAHFISLFCEQLGQPLPRWDKDFSEGLMRREWPGHVRQLKNEIEKILVLNSGAPLKLEDICSSQPVEDSLLLEDALHQHICHVLELCQGNKSQAAELLGIDRSTLYAKLRQREKAL